MFFRTRDLAISVTPQAGAGLRLPCNNILVSQLTPPCYLVVFSGCFQWTGCRFGTCLDVTIFTCVTNTLVTCAANTLVTCAFATEGCFAGTIGPCGGGTIFTDPGGGGDPMAALRQLREELQRSLAAVEAQEQTLRAQQEARAAEEGKPTERAKRR
jgi:hypothetical protein